MSEWWTYRLEDFLLFSPRVYWRLFELTNAALWPVQFATLGAGAALVLLALWRPRHHGLWIALVLAALWGFVGWAFLWSRYAAINWAIVYVAPLFAVEAILLALAGATGGLTFDRRGVPGWTGLLLAATGVLVYPLLPPLFGRPWASAEVFGIAPDPTAIVTIGLLLSARGRLLPPLLLPIPLLWLAVSGLTLRTMDDAQAWLPLMTIPITLAAGFLRQKQATWA